MPLRCPSGIVGPTIGMVPTPCACVDHLGSTTSWSISSLSLPPPGELRECMIGHYLVENYIGLLITTCTMGI